MRLLISFFLLSALLAPACYSQNEPDLKKEDKVVLTDKERVDTLLVYVRKQFYANNFIETIEVGEEALKIARSCDNRNTMFRISSLLGNAFLQINDTKQAKRIFFQTIQEAERLEDTTRSLTTARIDLGNLYAVEKKNELAIQKYREAIPLAEKLDDTTHLFVLHYNIAELSLDLKKKEQSNEYVRRTNLYSKGVTAKAYLSVAKLVNGRLAILNEDYENALPPLDESIQLALESGYTDALVEAYEVSSIANFKLENFEVAASQLQKIDSLKGEKYETDKILAVENATAKYKLNQYEQDLIAAQLQSKLETQKTRRETTLFWIKIAGVILIISAVFFIFEYVKRRRLLKNLREKNQQYLTAKEVSEKQVRAKNRLFSNITHELRTPMYGIVGISNLLQSDKTLDHHNENIKSLKFSAEYLLSLINNVLQYTQSDENINKPRNAQFQLKSLVNSVKESCEFINTTSPNRYHIHLDPHIPEILIGDEIKLTQILSNLMGNAAKFTQNGDITLEVEREADKDGKVFLQFYIQDSGVGISEERQETIFKEFADLSDDNEEQGAGMGLSIVKKLLALQGSEIHLESEEGKGTQVSFGLCFDHLEQTVVPKIKKQKKVEKTEKVEKTVQPKNSLSHRKVLVIDDNRINILVTTKTLERQGFNVISANNGREGVQLAINENPDLVLMDINMPGMNGYQATEQIRYHGYTMPIIALTAVEEEKIVASGKKDIFTAFVIKPYDESTFIPLITSYFPVEA